MDKLRVLTSEIIFRLSKRRNKLLSEWLKHVREVLIIEWFLILAICGTPSHVGHEKFLFILWEAVYTSKLGINFSNPCPTQQNVSLHQKPKRKEIFAPSHYIYVQLLTNCTARFKTYSSSVSATEDNWDQWVKICLKRRKYFCQRHLMQISHLVTLSLATTACVFPIYD